MTKKATTVDEQIEILRTRGMNFDMDIDKVKEILLDIGYYRLGFYWHFYEIGKTHEFKEHTNFSDIVALYYLDFDLRNLLLKYLNRIEIHFRTQIVYIVSNHYKDSPFWFIDKKIVGSGFVDNIHKYYTENFRKNNKTIKKHHEKYINDKYAPAWKTLEFLTFGNIFQIFKNLQNEELKSKISLIYGIKDFDKFENLLGTVLELRNTCSHGGVLMDFRTRNGIKKLPFYSFNGNNRHSFDCCIKVIDYLLKQISDNRAKEMVDKVNERLNIYKSHEKIKKLIEEKMGYFYVI